MMLWCGGPWWRHAGEVLDVLDTSAYGQRMTTIEATYKVGDKVCTNRYFGQTDWSAIATVSEIRTSDYVITYEDKAQRHSGDFLTVGRSAKELRLA